MGKGRENHSLPLRFLALYHIIIIIPMMKLTVVLEGIADEK